MDRKRIIAANREAWNEATGVHQRARGNKLKEGFAHKEFSTLDNIITRKMKQLHVEGKDAAQLCCNNGRELLSIINMGAKSGVGFDLSDEAIEEGRELAAIAGTNCRFVRTDVLEIGDEYNNSFDFVYISIGALSWLPDLDGFFRIVSRMLRKDGTLLIYEQHPFTYMLAAPDEPDFDKEHPMEVAYSYYRTEPWTNDTGIDYVGKTTYKGKEAFSFTQKLSDIFNAIIDSGINILEFAEFDHDIAESWDHIEKEKMIPLCYTLVGKKNH
ncbi:MAG: class I SAM-dependent methyltransferase [Candidatus Zixiibacteriota bacterium]